MICETNKAKCHEWAKQYLDETAKENGFLDVVFTDKTLVQLETHTWFCCRKHGELPKNKPRYSTNHVDFTNTITLTCIKHIYSVHVDYATVYVRYTYCMCIVCLLINAEIIQYL